MMNYNEKKEIEKIIKQEIENNNKQTETIVKTILEIDNRKSKSYIQIIIAILSLLCTIFLGVQTYNINTSNNEINQSNLERNKRADLLIYELGVIDGKFEYQIADSSSGEVLKSINSRKAAINISQGGLQSIYSISCNNKRINYITPATGDIVAQTNEKVSISVEWKENFTDLDDNIIYDYIFVFIKDNFGKSYLSTFFVTCNLNDDEKISSSDPFEIDEIEMLKYIQDRENLTVGMKQIVSDYEFVKEKLKEYR